MTSHPPDSRDLLIAAESLREASYRDPKGGSLERVADLCEQLGPVLDQYGPIIEAMAKAQDPNAPPGNLLQSLLRQPPQTKE